MDADHLPVFLAIVALGSFVQAFTGFALGLIVMGAATALDLAPIAFTAAVISIFAFFNGMWVLRQEHRDIHRKIAAWICAGLVPGVAVGLELLQYLGHAFPGMLRGLLGMVILTAGVILTLKPHPWKTLSRSPWSLAVGLLGGVLGGLFSTGGPPIVFYVYRQPLAIPAIRSTLLAIFVISTLARILFLALRGELTWDMLWMGLLALPVILVTAQLGARLTSRVPALLMRRIAFGLLVVLGVSLLLRG